MRTANTHDAIGRRHREKPQASGKRITPTERDILWFEKLHRHGPLATPYLLAYSKLVRRSDTRAKDRLTDLFNEDATPHGGTYLTRPWQQFETLDARYHDLVYDLTDRARALLAQDGARYEYTPHASGSWKHRFMTAAITASIELATLKTDNVRYIFQDEILSRANTALSFPVSITLNGQTSTKQLIPDGLFGLEYQDGDKRYYRFFLIEADRSTEPGMASTLGRKSYVRTILQYQQFVGRGLYKDALNLSAGLLALHVTTSELRLRNLLDLTAKHSGSGSNNYMLYRAAPEFGKYFTTPDVLYTLFTDPWHRAGKPAFHINSPARQ
jgi:hypothetical protein